MGKNKLVQLAAERSCPCVTISMNTNRTIPDNKQHVKDFNRLDEYLILELSRSDVRLLKATNDKISEEINNDHFQFAKNPYLLNDQYRSGNIKLTDYMVHEFFNQIDKALV